MLIPFLISLNLFLCLYFLSDPRLIGFSFFVDKAMLIAALGFELPTLVSSALEIAWRPRSKEPWQRCKLVEVAQFVMSALRLRSRELNFFTVHLSHFLQTGSLSCEVKRSMQHLVGTPCDNTSFSQLDLRGQAFRVLKAMV
jgi:hypothetical protein